MAESPKLLIVDDEESFVEALRAGCHAKGS